MTSDRALMRRIAEGSEGAAAELVRRHGGRMRAVAARILGSRDDAEDAVQRAFLQCLTAAGRYRPEWAVSTWLYRILTNVCADEIRRRRVRQRVGGSGHGWAPAGDGRSAGSSRAAGGWREPRGEGAADRAGARIDLRRALLKVPAEARLLLVLRYVDDLSYGELARVRGISVNTVKSQLARGKAILRTALEEGRP
jgi:RNA polymerase sigma-70 factor (ECF subfamily)